MSSSFRSTASSSSSSFCSSSSSSDYSRTKLLKKNRHPKKQRRRNDDVRASSSSSAFDEQLKLEWFNFGPRGTMLPQTFQQQQKSGGFLSTSGPLHVSTPLIYSQPLSERNERKTYIKMDNCQPSGSFKLRGLGYACQKALLLDGKKTFVSSSGGNAGLAVAYSGSKLGAKTTVVVPRRRLSLFETVESYEAKVIVHGKQWSEANELAEKIAAEEDAFFAHPFEGEDTWTGHATLVHEIMRAVTRRRRNRPAEFYMHLRRWRRFTSRHRARFTRSRLGENRRRRQRNRRMRLVVPIRPKNELVTLRRSPPCCQSSAPPKSLHPRSI